MSELAYRFRESVVRNYEPHIRSIRDAYPEVIKVVPANVETFSCRLRDAIKSYKENKWDPDLAAWLESNRVVVAIRGLWVVAGGPKEVAYFEAPRPIDVEREKGLEIPEPTPQIAEAVAILHHHGILKHRSVFYRPKDDGADIDFEALCLTYNIAIDFDPNHQDIIYML